MNDFLSGYNTYDPETEGYGSSYDWKQAFHERMNPDEAREILNEDSPWATLGLKENATKAEVKKAFRKLAMKWHPDKNQDNRAYAEEQMKKLNAAYSLLI